MLDVDINDVHHARKLAMGKLDMDTNDGHHARKLVMGKLDAIKHKGTNPQGSNFL